MASRSPHVRACANLAVLLWSAATVPACEDGDPASEGTTNVPDGDVPGDGDGDGSTDADDERTPPSPPGGHECPELSCLPCGQNRGCAATGPTIGDTCCAEGDAIVRLGGGSGSEVVDVETDGRFAWSCGGFGASIDDLSDPTAPVFVGGATRRCQRIGLGPVLAEDTRVFWLAHHGDTWVTTPFLATLHLTSSGEITEIDRIEAADISFEGLAFHQDTLYVATHTQGIRVYSTDDQGRPTFVRRVGRSLANATKLDVMDGRLYVADGLGGLAVFDVSEPRSPALVGTVDTPGLAGDVEAEDGQIFVALGSGGVEVLEQGDAELPTQTGHIDALGSVQSVDVEGDIVALAAWTHVAVHDRHSLQLLATQKTRSSPLFEQDLGIALHEDLLVVGEWRGIHTFRHHPGLIAPDIWIGSESFLFPADQSDTQVGVVRNRGYLDLRISEIEAVTADVESPFSVTPRDLRIPALEARAFEVSFEPPAPLEGTGALFFQNNDIDEAQNPLEVPLVAEATDRLDVGDKLGPEFGFLDPTGRGDVEGLEGNVTVLAYFALF